jgi:uncharacterized membrane protein YhaH (DUF805 family)
MQWYLMVWKRYAEFSGRSRRKEYWMFTLFNTIVYLLIYLPGFAVLRQNTTAASALIGLAFLYALAGIVPGLAVSMRRLHDTGKSGWWLLIGVIPLVAIVLFVLLAIKGDSGSNVYGPDPKASELSAAIS